MGTNTMAGKVVLITGAARGIGAESARRLASLGAKVALVGLEREQLEATAAECGPEAGAWEADVTDWEALETAVAGVVERYGAIDVVIANAGVAATGFVRSIDPAAFERTIEINLLGVWRTVRVCLPHLIRSRGYCLVVSSLAAISHAPGMAAYSASKAGCEAFADSLRAEVRHLGVDVGTAYFSWIATDMVNSADQHPVFGRMRSRLPGPIGRTYPVSEVGKAVAAGVNRRARAIHVPGWVAGLKLFRGIVNQLSLPIAAMGAKDSDQAALDDVKARGADASRPVGPGGAAGFDSAERRVGLSSPRPRAPGSTG
ncbi:SDR family oxidoreductase [Kutzneria kofuensis]|uniref:NAD(P)-dependent dehydrogenase (Short-subunit alcohol dehydrogenase family) n=1 Tax=Kutzneria kofuensis TaxID=103725 RepID=A0A7W9KHR7_9PSEU|nr:SDR family oxidoreductase [Kutzneria kofuensis]MBB5892861.1 NAD(P)-dependent dehydrogenase (short-subunit alcohol dehydrogenase family) [Kutzneria kofuensis]